MPKKLRISRAVPQPQEVCKLGTGGKFSSQSWLDFLPIVILVTACSTPYALKIDSIDEDTPETTAVIAISDPQVYARESLINDRRREAEYLNKLIEDSPNKKFEPQLKRELQSVASTALALGGSFNPALGDAATRSEELAQLNQQIAATDKQIQLVQKRAELDSLAQALAEAKLRQSGVDVPMAPPSTPGDAPEPDAGDGQPIGGGEGDDPDPEEDSTPDGSQPGQETAEKIAALEASVQSLQAEVQALQSGSELEAQQALTESILSQNRQTEATITRLKNALPGVSAITGTSVPIDPLDEFRDRKVYREELRSALAEVQLDDAHDNNNNSLYRLQFRGTVFPGPIKNKYGVARLTLLPPMLDDPAIDALYKTWIAHINGRLNDPEIPARYIVGVDSDLYSIHSIDINALLKRPDTNDCLFSQEISSATKDRLIVAMPPRITRATTRHIQSANALSQTLCALEQSNSSFERVQQAELQINELRSIQPDDVLGQAKVLGYFIDEPEVTDELRRNVESGIRWIEESLNEGEEIRESIGGDCQFTSNAQDITFVISPKQFYEEYWPLVYVQSALMSAITTRLARLPPHVEAQENPLLVAAEIVSQLVASITTYHQRLSELLGNDCPQRIMIDAEKLDDLPPLFKVRVIDPRLELPIADGASYAYSTAPIELTQRMSTTASALNAFELGVALSGKIPQKGLGLEAAVNYLRAAQGRVEGIERNPLVVGFSDRSKTAYQTPDRIYMDKQVPQFGWVFGPTVALNPEESRLELIQRVHNYNLTADISVPGWWPTIDLCLETTWSDKWDQSNLREVIDPGTSPTCGSTDQELFTLRLPLNKADLDGLTELLLHKSIGSALPELRITNVSPKRLLLCETEATFLVEGENIWRSTEAYLNGRKQSAIQILPDMAGVAVTFDVKDLPIASADYAELTIWTRNGGKSTNVELVDAALAGQKCLRPGIKSMPTPANFQSLTTVTYADKDATVFSAFLKSGVLEDAFSKRGFVVREAENAWSQIGEGETTITIDGGKTIFSQSIPKELLATNVDFGANEVAEQIQIGIGIQERPRSPVEYRQVTGTVVVYKTKVDGLPHIETQEIAELDEELVLKPLPAMFAQAYPAFAKSSKVMATIKKGEVIQATVSGDFTVDSLGKAVVKLPGGTRNLDRGDDLQISLVLTTDNRELEVQGTTRLKKWDASGD